MLRVRQTMQNFYFNINIWNMSISIVKNKFLKGKISKHKFLFLIITHPSSLVLVFLSKNNTSKETEINLRISHIPFDFCFLFDVNI